MIVYLDTGFFLDFFSQRSRIALDLRSKSRRGRSILQIQADSVSIMNKLNGHKAITSVISMLEYNDRTYETLKKSFPSLPDIKIENIMKAKSEAAIFLTRCARNKIRVVPLDTCLLEKAVRSSEYDNLKINDAIHVQTARSKGASVIISTDHDLLKFDKVFGNIRIVDSDEGIMLL